MTGQGHSGRPAADSRVELVVTNDVAAEFAERVVEAFHARPHDAFALALSGGTHAPDCYRALASHAGTDIDWWKVDIYWTDEVCDAGANHHLVRDTLLEQVGAANASYPIRCEDGPDAYQLRIGELGRFDAMHLALGPDGTVAALFPGSPALGADDGRLVAANQDPSGQHPGHYITLTPAGISRARLVLVTAVGAACAPAVAALKDADATLPVGMLATSRLLADTRVVCIADPEASATAAAG